MKNLTKKILIPTLLLTLFLITISASSAAENTTDLGNLITDANDGATIHLDGTYKNNVTNITIDKSLTIIGKDPKTTIIDAQQSGRIFNIRSNGALTLINITLINGRSNGGGAIYNNGSLKVTNSIFKDNHVFNNEGGAIYNLNSTNVNISNCTFDNNSVVSFGGAISSVNVTNMNIIKCVFINNRAGFGGAIATDDCENTKIINSTFANNSADVRGGVFALDETNSIIQGCNIYNNTKSIYIEPNSIITINYNRILNNTGDYYLFNRNSENVNADYNWWGDNTPDMTKIIGTDLNNYFIMNVTNLTSLVSNGTVTFLYTFKLNSTDSFNASLLPYFTTEVITNLTTGIIKSFDARYDNTFDIKLQSSGDVLYTFTTDNEVQTLQGTMTIPTNIIVNNSEGKDGETVILTAKLTDENGKPLAGKEVKFHIAVETFTAITDSDGIATIQYTINKNDFTNNKLTFTVTFEGDENYTSSNTTGTITLKTEPVPPTPPIPPKPTPTPTPTPTPEPNNNGTNNNPVAGATMKTTGLPINILLIVLLSVLTVLIGRKQN